jgi:hypothetical protein
MTGWTLPHVRNEVTLPDVVMLSAYWRMQPPMVVLMSRVCRSLGVEVSAKPVKVARTAAEAVQEAHQFGLPIAEGRPDDPMLAFLDL